MRIKNLIEGLNAQQRSVPQLPAQAKAKHISVLGSKTDPKHPFAGYMVGADESAEPGAKRLGPDKNDPYEQGWRANPATAYNPYKKGTPEHTQWEEGQAERQAQPRHYDESAEDDIPDLEEVGETVLSIMDAERRLAAGDRIFVAHEMDEEPFEVFNVGDLKGYTYDQMLAVPQELEESEHNELDTPSVQAALRKMAERHKGEKWSKEQLAALGKRIAARGQKPVKEDDVEDFLARGGKITHVKPNRGPRNPGLSLASRHIGGSGDRMKASRTGRGSKPQGKPVVAVESVTKEDIISKLKSRLGDYLSDISKEIKKDPDLIDKLAAKAPGNQMGPPVKTITTDDGHEIQIHGNEDDGFRISIKNKQAASKFKNLDEALMACEMYCAHRRTQALNADYVEEACWTGYEQQGMKKKGSRHVPNCVRKNDESLEKYVDEGVCPSCGGEMVAEELVTEKQDACYHKVKSRYKIWPSAYASGALVRCRKVGAANWGNKSKK